MEKMKNIKFLYSKLIVLLAFVLTLSVSCERDFSDEVEFATNPTNGEVFIDNFSSGLDYFPFVDAGADPEAFSVSTDDVFMGSASIRFDVPTFGNGFVGATFNTTSNRDLSGYDALTFYAKASQAASIDAIGFGISGETANKYQVERNGLNVSTNWKKYIIPIPDASKLIDVTGLFYLAEGASSEDDEGGYILWFDEIQFEKLGTVAQARPSILNGNDVNQQTFKGSSIQLSGLTQTFNLASGVNQTVSAAPSYFTFKSSDPDVAQVNELGEVSIVGTGTAVITAILDGVRAEGSLILEALGALATAPNPTEDPSKVISIFSDAYTNVPVDFYNGFFGEFQTTQGGADININGDNIIKYTQLNFVATEFKNPTVDASGMDFFHVDIQIQEPIDAGDFIRIELGDFGSNAAFGGGDDSSGTFTLAAEDLSSNQWISLDIPLASFNGLTNRSNLAQIFFVSDGTISTILVDNMYFYTE